MHMTGPWPCAFKPYFVGYKASHRAFSVFGMKITKILRLKRLLHKYSRYNMVTKIVSSTVYLGGNGAEK